MKFGEFIDGCLILVGSIALMVIPIIGLLVMFTFIAGIIYTILFHPDLLCLVKSNMTLFKTMAFTGIIILAFTAGFASIVFTEHLAAINKNEVAMGSGSTFFLVVKIILLILTASTLIFLAIRSNKNLNNNWLFIILLPTIVIIPVVTLPIKFRNDWCNSERLKNLKLIK